MTPAATVTDVRSATPPHGASDAALGAGDLLAGRYRVDRLIASGGMGEVYRADDTVLGEPVALKLLRCELVAEPAARTRFGDEIRLARKVTHANVCRVFDVGVDGDLIFYTMELYRGDTLADLLAGRGPLPVDRALPLVRQMLAGVAAAHDAGVIHADLKPSNMLLAGAERDRIVITDFGLRLRHAAPAGHAGLHLARAGPRRRRQHSQ
jgi:serine/threonine-protein kinase